MLDYKKILKQENTKQVLLEIAQSQKRIDICGDKKSLRYFVCKLAEFVEEECCIDEKAEINFDIGEFTTEDSCHLCVYLYDKLDESK